jgi:hypothetical protein
MTNTELLEWKADLMNAQNACNTLIDAGGRSSQVAAIRPVLNRLVKFLAEQDPEALLLAEQMNSLKSGTYVGK